MGEAAIDLSELDADHEEDAAAPAISPRDQPPATHIPPLNVDAAQSMAQSSMVPSGKSSAVKLWQKGNAVRVAGFMFESFEVKKARKALRRNPKLIQVFGGLWEACGADQALLLEGYMGYHLSVSRGVAELTGDGADFDAVDAFDAALDDWEHDTKYGGVIRLLLAAGLKLGSDRSSIRGLALTPHPSPYLS